MLSTGPVRILSSAYTPCHIHKVHCLDQVVEEATGLRIDRFLYERFQRLCLTEKLRPGEAVGHLIRLAVDTGSVAEVYARTVKTGRTGQAIDDVLFAS
ncbi:MAG TPA: hypothetical protein VFV92_09545 [Candidatus Bathyarchaeia archaeon]|nr:hypothetical protein [Candidatus Bathyarchaeia archaeon]